MPDPDPPRWREQLKDVARAQRQASLRHPYLVRITIGRIPMGPNALHYTERVVAILRAGSLPPHLAVQRYMTSLADEFAFADADERFELLIDIFVDGLGRRAATP